jgi:hypothetical protein
MTMGSETDDKEARRAEHIREAEAKRQKGRHIQHGTGDEHDPQWMAESTTHEQMEEWLAAIESNIGAKRKVRGRGGRDGATMPLFSQWEKDTLQSFRTQYDKHKAEGRAQRLTGNQLVVLKVWVNKLAEDTAATLEQDRG